MTKKSTSDTAIGTSRELPPTIALPTISRTKTALARRPSQLTIRHPNRGSVLARTMACYVTRMPTPASSTPRVGLRRATHAGVRRDVLARPRPESVNLTEAPVGTFY